MANKTLQDKLDNPEIVKKMAMHFLEKFSIKVQHDGRFDGDDLELIFFDLPHRKMYIEGYVKGYVLHPERINKKDINFISINWRNQGYFWNLNDSTNAISSKDSKEVYLWVNRKDGGEKTMEFEKGKWQEYLAQCYLSSLPLGDLNFKEKNILL